MGYHTEFTGSFTFSPALRPDQVAVIQRFAATRHGDNMYPYIIPNSFWCQWTVSDDGRSLVWDEQEKFYGYIHWLHHLNKMFFAKWRVCFAGTIIAQGEDENDRTEIVATIVGTSYSLKTQITPALPNYEQ